MVEEITDDVEEPDSEVSTTEPVEVQKLILDSKGNLQISFTDEVLLPESIQDIYEEDKQNAEENLPVNSERRR